MDKLILEFRKKIKSNDSLEELLVKLSKLGILIGWFRNDGEYKAVFRDIASWPDIDFKEV